MLFCDEVLFYFFGRERSIFVSKNKCSATVIIVLLMKQTDMISDSKKVMLPSAVVIVQLCVRRVWSVTIPIVR